MAQQAAPAIPDHNTDVVVVGAGISGLRASQALLDRHPGLQLTLLEAHSAPGGRVRGCTETFPGFRMELGAEFVHGQRRVGQLWDAVERAGLPVDYCYSLAHFEEAAEEEARLELQQKAAGIMAAVPHAVNPKLPKTEFAVLDSAMLPPEDPDHPSNSHHDDDFDGGNDHDDAEVAPVPRRAVIRPMFATGIRELDEGIPWCVEELMMEQHEVREEVRLLQADPQDDQQQPLVAGGRPEKQPVMPWSDRSMVAWLRAKAKAFRSREAAGLPPLSEEDFAPSELGIRWADSLHACEAGIALEQMGILGAVELEESWKYGELNFRVFDGMSSLPASIFRELVQHPGFVGRLRSPATQVCVLPAGSEDPKVRQALAEGYTARVRVHSLEHGLEYWVWARRVLVTIPTSMYQRPAGPLVFPELDPVLPAPPHAIQRNLAASDKERLVFQPALPAWKREAIRQLPAFEAAKILLQFRRRVWPATAAPNDFFCGFAPVDRNNADPERPQEFRRPLHNRHPEDAGRRQDPSLDEDGVAGDAAAKEPCFDDGLCPQFWCVSSPANRYGQLLDPEAVDEAGRSYFFVGFAGGRHTRMEGMSDAEVLEATKRWLTYIWPDAGVAEAFVAGRVHRWSQKPYVRAGYTGPTIGGNFPARQALQLPLSPADLFESVAEDHNAGIHSNIAGNANGYDDSGLDSSMASLRIGVGHNSNSHNKVKAPPGHSYFDAVERVRAQLLDQLPEDEAQRPHEDDLEFQDRLFGRAGRHAVLFFAGEAAAIDGCGSVHGALESGELAARQILGSFTV